MEKIIKVEVDTELIEASQYDVLALTKKVEAIEINNQEDYQWGCDFLKIVKSRITELDKQRKEITAPMDVAKKAVMDLYRKPLAMLETAESNLKRLIISYTDKKEMEARIEQQRLEKLAQQEAERQKKLIDAKIARAEASGKLDKIADLEEQKEGIQEIVIPTVTAQINKAEGVSFRMNYKVVVTDFSLLPNEYKLPNETALNKIANATKGSINIPGTKIISEKILASRK